MANTRSRRSARDSAFFVLDCLNGLVNVIYDFKYVNGSIAPASASVCPTITSTKGLSYYMDRL